MKMVLVSDTQRYKAFYNDLQRAAWSDPLRQEVLAAEMEDAADVLRRNAPPWMQGAPFLIMFDNHLTDEGGDWPRIAYLSKVEMNVPVAGHKLTHTRVNDDVPRLFSEAVLTYRVADKPTLRNIWNFLPLNWSFCVGAWVVCVVQILWNVVKILVQS